METACVEGGSSWADTHLIAQTRWSLSRSKLVRRTGCQNWPGRRPENTQTDRIACEINKLGIYRELQHYERERRRTIGDDVC